MKSIIDNGVMIMPDREKVIKGLEICKSTDKTCSDCPYNGEICTTSLCDDAIALLKEQDERIKELELEKGWDESPEMMGKW